MEVKRYKIKLFNKDDFNFVVYCILLFLTNTDDYKLERNVVIGLAEVIAGSGGGHGDRIVSVECECGALLAT